MKYLLVFSPILLFLLIQTVIVIALWRSKYKLSDALSGDVAVPTPDGGQEYPRSTSRLIMFLCGITSIVLVLSLCTAQLYMVVCLGDREPLDFQNIITAAITLGLGVVPYSVKQVSGIFRKSE